MPARETHWDCTITCVDHNLHVTCGCGWSDDVTGANERSVITARRLWDDHDCAGRPLEDVGPVAVLGRGGSVSAAARYAANAESARASTYGGGFAR